MAHNKQELEKILEQYWGYNTFRPLQKDIIQSVLNQTDTMALLPTGGGKSICYQVPALAQNGVCLVISPLISLMKDQVLNLRKRGVKAAALISGMHNSEIELITENAKYNQIKVLYLSPERLGSADMKHRLSFLPVNLIAVDEAHCISQWGYDFRPSYLKIAEIRELFPKIPVLALTATATPKVVTDIQEKLGFKNLKVFQKSFERKSLAYRVYFEENKWNRLVLLLNQIDGSAVVYTRSRNFTQKVAEFLEKNNISAAYYHAGLDSKTREQIQNQWVNNQKRVMVATNAFGMGIDKPDVRLVIHVQIPESIEAYFQEAGRAGRDEKPAVAITLYEEADIKILSQKIATTFPPKDFIKRVYQAIGSYYQLATGAGKDCTFEFDLEDFATRYHFPKVECFNALKILEKNNYISITDAVELHTRIHIKANNYDLYNFQIKNPNYDTLIKLLLRTYSGLFEQFSKINTYKIARLLKVTEQDLHKAFLYMQKIGLIDYLPHTNKPQIIFTEDRIPVENVSISKESYEVRKAETEKRIEAITLYLKSQTRCRSEILLTYFGEKKLTKCGVCDYCLSKKNTIEFENKALAFLQSEAAKNKPLQQLSQHFTIDEQEMFEKYLQHLINDGFITLHENQTITWL